MNARKDNRGGSRPNAGRKPKDGQRRRYINVSLVREVVEALPDYINRCELITGLVHRWLNENGYKTDTKSENNSNNSL